MKQSIQDLNSNQTTGTLQTDGFHHLIKVDGGLDNAKQFSNAIISYQNESPVRLKDITTVKNSIADDKALTEYNNKRAIVLTIQRQPGSKCFGSK
ncbi:efflux RND transporter permease subunit [Coxiella endosymbiont of Ornithodoros maritimus]|uniref:efflux RND transporter permease subunit n=1 Tax=Coxiella endosymbiont of Ornithodoros maritimus TaxID=1656172 RepID=UPI00226472DE|nr:efflux RND transporter permease subunit [Coxiella endosymbiont of Ornithodoros maritimus]